MLADQFLAAAAGARNAHALDETARLLWRAHAEGHMLDADAHAISEALQRRRAAFSARLAYPPGRPVDKARQRPP